LYSVFPGGFDVLSIAKEGGEGFADVQEARGSRDAGKGVVQRASSEQALGERILSYLIILPLVGGIDSKDLENINSIFGVRLTSKHSCCFHSIATIWAILFR
jgi:hypothetical protein